MNNVFSKLTVAAVACLLSVNVYAEKPVCPCYAGWLATGQSILATSTVLAPTGATQIENGRYVGKESGGICGITYVQNGDDPSNFRTVDFAWGAIVTLKFANNVDSNTCVTVGNGQVILDPFLSAADLTPGQIAACNRDLKTLCESAVGPYPIVDKTDSLF